VRARPFSLPAGTPPALTSLRADQLVAALLGLPPDDPAGAGVLNACTIAGEPLRAACYESPVPADCPMCRSDLAIGGVLHDDCPVCIASIAPGGVLDPACRVCMESPRDPACP